MKINSVRISNLLSFENVDEIDNAHEIKFSDGFNVIIGANGAGKSNFLEILNQLLYNGIMSRYQYRDEHILAYKSRGQTENLNQTIIRNQVSFQLPKNRQSIHNTKRIKIEIGLTDNDAKNLIFIRNNLSKIDELFKKYCANFPAFNPTVTDDDLKKSKSITLLFEDLGSNYLSNMTKFANITEEFISLYLQNFNLLQYLIMIANNEDSQDWPPLKNTIAKISSYRNYSQISPDFLVQMNENDALSSIMVNLANDALLNAENKEPLVFSYVKHKIGYAFHNMLNEKGLQKGLDPIDSFTDPMFISINKILSDVLGLKLYIKRIHPNALQYRFSFVNKKDNAEVSIPELSAGEKGLINFIFAIYGSDVENGVMIIDEPELHMHPQMQELCLEIIKKIEKDRGIQFIVVTHSPLFVNSKTIDGVQRFYKDNNGFTKTVISAKTNDEKDLVRYLDFTKATNVLFVNKVVLVEGDSDEYFYRFYFEKYQENKERIESIDFIHIIGKDYYKQWKKFFDDWKIRAFFIRDLDDFKGDSTQIERKYDEDIFILKQGDLETYIGDPIKNKLENAVDFCKNRYETWKEDGTNKSKIDELNLIYDSITS